ncbi:uncharacterized protein LOC143265319 [Megachile rotundata]|uniref:uncharacterized protein LOC143265319 n=1 Tax=Megachile rotundata TaxID=143995 RepID=UPI003FD3AA13
MLCGTFRKKRRHPGDEYRLVRSNTMPKILSVKEGSLVSVRRTKSSRVAARSSHLRDLLHSLIRWDTSNCSINEEIGESSKKVMGVYHTYWVYKVVINLRGL